MFLAGLYGRTGRLVEARAELTSLREEFAFGAYAIFDGFLLGVLAWLDNKEGRHEEALALVREAATTARDPMALMVAPQLPAVHLLIAAVALLGLGGPRRERDAARLLGAYRALVPTGHFPVTTEREDAALVEKSARTALGDRAYEAACAEGGGLTLEEATALV